MPAVIETVVHAIDNGEQPGDVSEWRDTKTGRFTVGNPGGPGKPKGYKNAATIYLNSLPLKARQWVKSEHPSVLIDARKIALPIEADALTDAVTNPVLIVFGSPPVAADASPTVTMPLSAPQSPSLSAVSSVEQPAATT